MNDRKEETKGGDSNAEASGILIKSEDDDDESETDLSLATLWKLYEMVGGLQTFL